MFHDGFMGGMWFGWLFWLVILVLIVWVIVNQLNKNKKDTQTTQQESVLYILKKRHIMKKAICLLSLISFIFQGCMVGGIGMMGMGHHQDHGKMNSEKVISKEVIISNYKFAAEFPIPQQHSEVNYTLQIYDRITNERIIQSEVWFEVTKSGKDNSTDVEKLVSTKIETDENENYVYSFAFHSEEEVQVGFKIYSIENEKFVAPIEIFSNQKVIAEHSKHESGNWIDPLWIIGAAAMTAIMIFVHL